MGLENLKICNKTKVLVGHVFSSESANQQIVSRTSHIIIVQVIENYVHHINGTLAQWGNA